MCSGKIIFGFVFCFNYSICKNKMLPNTKLWISMIHVVVPLLIYMAALPVSHCHQIRLGTGSTELIVDHHLSGDGKPKGQCVMYGVCDESQATPGTNLTCVYNGPPKKLQDEGRLASLKLICPELIEASGDEVCCSPEQIDTLETNLALPEGIIARCPSCFFNFRQSVCNLACGPNQSLFLNVTKSIKSQTINDTFAVTEIHFYASEKYIQGTYDSCKNVSMSSTNEPAMDLLCGPWGAVNCTAHRWYDYMGSTSNGYSPFDIIYEYAYDNYTDPFDPFLPDKVFRCNERINDETSPCSCVDCEASCEAPPQPFPPVEPEPWKLFGADGISVLMGVICLFGNIVIAFLIIMFSDDTAKPAAEGSERRESTPATTPGEDHYPQQDQTRNRHPSNHLEQNRLLPDGEVLAMYPLAQTSLLRSVQNSIKKMFGVIGESCANHVYITLLLLLIPFALSTALLTPYFKITTNPVELWASPHSRTRIEKNFFDKNFAPFFRTEQIIIASKNPPFQRPNSEQMFGPVLQKDFLIALSKLQEDIENLNNGSLRNICLKPLETNCTIFSLMEYWQNSVENLNKTVGNDTNYLDHFLFCAKNPTSMKDSTKLHQNCQGRFGGPVDSKLVLGGIPKGEGEEAFKLANATVLTFVVRNHVNEADNKEAEMWESAFINYMKDWISMYESKLNISVAFNSERSVQDELSRESEAEVTTILISYIIMFIYISMSLGFGEYFVYLVNKCTWRRYFWWQQLDRRPTVSIEEEVFPSSASDTAPLVNENDNPFKSCLPRLLLSLVGVFLVLLSVTASIGLFSFCGVSATLIVMEVVPFLVLAVGVDNIFIIVQTYDRIYLSGRSPADSIKSVPEKIGHVMADIGPSLLISVISESVCFFIGGSISPMPAVSTFAFYGAVALIMDFLLQITVFIAVFGACEKMADKQRSGGSRRDAADDRTLIINDVTAATQQEPSASGASSPTTATTRPATSSRQSSPRRPISLNNHHQQRRSRSQERNSEVSAGGTGIITSIFTYCYAPFILVSKWTRMGILMVFYSWLCLSVALVHRVDVGLDQKLSMPSDSYVLKYFNSLADYLEVGPPVYFVVASNDSSPTLSDPSVQTKIAASGSSFSLVSQISQASKISNESFIAKPASSWMDDYIDWAANRACCRITKDGNFCPNSNTSCSSCNIKVQDSRMSPEDFRQYISFFLQDIPSELCPKAGHAAYSSAVSLGTVKNKTEVVASYFMSYHTVLRTSHDFTYALKQAQFLSDNITKTLDNEFLVFPYSVFYVFYEQYLTTYHQVLLNLGLSLAGVCLVVLIGTFSLKETLLVFITILCIVTDLIGMMYVFRISLNALSLVNLVLAVGISCEFSIHVVCAFARINTDENSPNVEKVRIVLEGVGSSVFSGITLTKIAGIIVLGFAKTMIFEVFYFRMYLLIVLIGAAHGLCFLPVLMSFVGGGSKKQT